MRVSTRLMNRGLEQRVQKLQEDLMNLNEKIASGKVINRPSDGPMAVVDSMAIKSSLSQIEQYQRGIKTGVSWLELRESALGEIKDLLARAVEIGTELGSDNQSADTRASGATEVGQLLEEAITLGNSELGGNYIFAGYRLDTLPFTATVVGGIETADYNGDTNDFQLRIGKDDTIVVGKNGQSTLMNSNLFTALGTLKKALEDNDGDAIRQQLDQLKSADDYLANEIADTGAKANRLDVKDAVWSRLTLNLKERLSAVEDADLAEMVTELRQKEVAYEAAMMSSARLSELSILNYMR